MGGVRAEGMEGMSKAEDRVGRWATAMKGEVKKGGNEQKGQRKRHRVRQMPFQDPEGSEAPAPRHASGWVAPRNPGPEVKRKLSLQTLPQARQFEVLSGKTLWKAKTF